MPEPKQRGIRAVSATYTIALGIAHSNAGSLTHSARAGIKPATSCSLVGFANHCATTGTPVRFFYHEWIMDLVKYSFCIYEMIMCFLTFLLLIWCITLIDLHMLNHPCELGMKIPWLWYMLFVMRCWIWFCRILLRIFTSIFIEDIGL